MELRCRGGSLLRMGSEGTGQSRKGQEQEAWELRLLPCQLRLRGLRDKLSENRGGMECHWIPLDPACCSISTPPPTPSSSTLKNLGVPITAPQPLRAGTSLCQDKGTSEQESQKLKQDWLQSLLAGLLSSWRAHGGSGPAQPWRQAEFTTTDWWGGIHTES